jgi:hypothetical protein
MDSYSLSQLAAQVRNMLLAAVAIFVVDCCQHSCSSAGVCDGLQLPEVPPAQLWLLLHIHRASDMWHSRWLVVHLHSRCAGLIC